MNADLDLIRGKKAFIIDMDGVLYHGNRLLKGAAEFVAWLKQKEKRFLFLTNSSSRSPIELSHKLARLGIEVEPEHFYTSALATAGFLSNQHPGGTVYAIGEPGLINALYDAGYTMNDVNPDYVVVGESSAYTYDTVVKAVRLVLAARASWAQIPTSRGPWKTESSPPAGPWWLP